MNLVYQCIENDRKKKTLDSSTHTERVRLTFYENILTSCIKLHLYKNNKKRIAQKVKK